MVLANVIFPAPSAAYVVNLLFPLSAVLALAAEFAVFVWLQDGVIPKWRLLRVVVGINVFSWVAGLVLSIFLPSGLVPTLVGEVGHQVRIITPGPQWNTIAIAGFVWACFLSFGLEYGALRLFRRRLPLRRLALCVGVANLASYCVIAAVVAAHALISR